MKENNILKDEINRTPNTPAINTITNFSGKVFADELFNVMWNASDVDNGTLAYAILFSADNGDNYSTLEIDYNSTKLELNDNKVKGGEI